MQSHFIVKNHSAIIAITNRMYFAHLSDFIVIFIDSLKYCNLYFEMTYDNEQNVQFNMIFSRYTQKIHCTTCDCVSLPVTIKPENPKRLRVKQKTRSHD